MSSRRVRRILFNFQLAALPLALGGCDDVSRHRVTLDRDDAAYAARIAACTTDAASCAQLCEALARDRNLGGYNDADSVVSSCELTDSDAASVTLAIEVTNLPEDCGRRPSGLCAAPVRGATLAGAWLAASARLEAASVHAFAQLARNLAAHRAPSALIRAALRAAGDEVRHAAVMSRLARTRGTAPIKPIVLPSTVPSLEDLALDNALEGCVRESFGVVLALHQAATATDRDVRATMALIAVDETEHAVLAAAVASWADARLDGPARARVAAARRCGLAALPDRATTMAAALDEPTRHALGLPAPAAAATLARAFAHAVA